MNYLELYGNLERMKIVVLVKHVPDVQSERRIENGLLVRGEDDVLNELDENAIEAAVSLVEENSGEVIALTMGPEDAEDAVRRALQMGADRAVVVSDERLAGSDVIGTAQVLAAAISEIAKDGSVDLVITGMASLDGMTSMLPGALAANLSWPALTLAQELTVTDGKARIRKVADGFEDVFSAPLPAVISVTDQVNEPRYPAFKAMAAARKKPVDFLDLDDLDLIDEAGHRAGIDGAGTQVLDAAQAPARSSGRIVADSGNGGQELAAWLHAQGK